MSRPITAREAAGVFTPTRLAEGERLKASLDALYLADGIDAETYWAARYTLAMTHGAGRAGVRLASQARRVVK